MATKVTLGGERLGAGKRMKVELHGFERSNHNLSYIWRSTVAPGTLVPFMNEVALPGDTFDIDLNMDGLTHPTIGPLFGSYDMEAHVYQVPVRLYQGKLHMNLLGVGRDMSKIMLPQVELKGSILDFSKNIDNQQISPSCIFSHLGIRGVGTHATNTSPVNRNFNAIDWLAYWDIVKQYYSNKQEDDAYVIHRSPLPQTITITTATIIGGEPSPVILSATFQTVFIDWNTTINIATTGVTSDTAIEDFLIEVQEYEAGGVPVTKIVKVVDYYYDWEVNVANQTVIGSNPTPKGTVFRAYGNVTWGGGLTENENVEPKLVAFPLKNIDDMRKGILGAVGVDTPVFITDTSAAPYGLALQNYPADNKYSTQYGQEGLAVKTYKSDLFNNWLNTEWIDGADGINEITKIDTTDGLYINELLMKRKIYDMLNRVAVSGGSYDDWLEVMYDHDRVRTAENPMYIGGLMKELVFQEVVSNSRSLDQPLGTLAGRGKVGNKHKGGKIIVKVDEPCVIMAIFSLTPRIDYSQGNKWHTNLKTMNDFHKPSLDQIGFQDLITDQMAWWDTQLDGSSNPQYKSAGKQPAWLNYMTNVNVVRGNFADQNQQMFMTLNRRYEADTAGGLAPTIKDLTTYIDPSKFNHIFADTRRDAQNFWIQIAVNIEARRKMSAKLMPNL